MQHIFDTAAGAKGPGRRLVERALQGLRWPFHRLADTLAQWHFRAESRRELERLDDRLLRDAGIDRAEANKPFWRE